MKTALLLCALLPFVVHAQTFPAKTVRIIIGVTPGSFSDNLARALAAELTRTWSQPIVIENRIGISDDVAAEAAAAEAAARAAPDGHTIYQANGGLLMTNQLLRKKPPFDIDRDFTPVHGLVRTSHVLLVRSSVSASTVADLVALARAKPGQLNYGSVGIGSGPHISTEKLSLAAGIRANHVPYEDGPGLARGLITGQIDFAFSGLGSMAALLRQRQVRAVAWGGPERSPALPEVPTLLESGHAFDTGSWLGWMVPAGTPQQTVDWISAEVGRALVAPGFIEKILTAQGLEPLNIPPPQFAALVQDTRSTYATLFSKMDLKLD